MTGVVRLPGFQLPFQLPVLGGQPLVVRLERPVVAPQLVDLRDRADDGANLDADPVDGILGGSQGIGAKIPPEEFWRFW